MMSRQRVTRLLICTIAVSLPLTQLVTQPEPVLATAKLATPNSVAIKSAQSPGSMPTSKSLTTTLSTQTTNIGLSPAQATTQTTRKLTMAQAVQLALDNNLELKLLQEDLKFRELDQDKADFYSDAQRDANSNIRNGWDEYYEKKAEFDRIKDSLPPDVREAIQAQLDNIYAKLVNASQYKTDTLSEAQVAELIQEKARVGYVLTSAGKDLAAKKITLLTQKTYYDTLKAKRMLGLKNSALQRAQSQLKLAQAGYSEGMRAKDDYLLAQCQVDLMRADAAKAGSDFIIAATELNEVLNLPADTKLELVDDFTTQPLQFNLEQQLKISISKRLEVQKAQMELEIAKINFELAKRYTSSNTFEYREAFYTVEKAEIELKKQKAAVEVDIRQAAANLNATQAMLKYIENSNKQAKESLDIATMRYQEGFGLPNSTLKGLNAEDAAGTILEVLAAEEKLAEVEEKVTEIIYSYNLARTNYLISVGEELTK